jgi:chloride channel protein, CIC family
VKSRPGWQLAACVGAAIAIVGWFLPGVLGGGNRLVERTLAGQIAPGALAGFFLLRFAMTMASYGCGAPGGIFAPLLVLGSEIGLAIGLVASHFFPTTIDHPESYAVVGMAGYFSAIVRAPLTGIVLIVEMTGNYSLVLPLLVACLTSYGLADFLRDRPVYEALLERDLARGDSASALESTLLVEHTIAPGAPFDGKKVRELGLPSGCILILLTRGLREEVPTAETELAAGDRITAVVAPQAKTALALLRGGTAAPLVTG